MEKKDRMEHTSKEDAVKILETRLQAAVAEERFLVAVWVVKDGRIEYLGRTGWKFPHADFLSAASFLLNDMSREVQDVQSNGKPQKALELAAFLENVAKEGGSVNGEPLGNGQGVTELTPEEPEGEGGA